MQPVQTDPRTGRKYRLPEPGPWCGESNGWICEMITYHYLPELNLNHSELAADVNSFFQFRQSPTDCSEFAARKALREGDPKLLKWFYCLVRLAYWSIFDINPTFWINQFTRKTCVANFLVGCISLVLKRSGRSDSSQRLLSAQAQHVH